MEEVGEVGDDGSSGDGGGKKWRRGEKTREMAGLGVSTGSPQQVPGSLRGLRTGAPRCRPSLKNANFQTRLPPWHRWP